jgi:hypothetical protein
MKKLDKKGMTLVESLIASAVATMIFVAVMGVWIGSAKIYDSVDDYVQIQHDATFIMDRIIKDITPAQSIYDCYPTILYYQYIEGGTPGGGGTLIIRTNNLPYANGGEATGVKCTATAYLDESGKDWGDMNDYVDYNLHLAKGSAREQVKIISSHPELTRLTLNGAIDPAITLPEDRYYGITPPFVIYDLNGTTLTRIIGAKNKWLSSKVLSEDVESIKFDCDPDITTIVSPGTPQNVTSVTVTLKVKRVSPSGDSQTQTLNCRAWLRNK